MPAASGSASLYKRSDLGVDVQAPAAVLIEPSAELGRVAAHESERVRVVGVPQERSSEERPGRAPQIAPTGFLERRVESRAHATSLRSVAVRSTIGACAHGVEGGTGSFTRACSVSASSVRCRVPYSPDVACQSWCMAASSGALCKPDRQLAEVGRAVRAAGAALVQRCDDGEQVGNRLACTDAQQLRLARVTGLGQEPLPKPKPPFPPRGHVGGERLGAEVLRRERLTDPGRGVLSVATGDEFEQPVEPGGIEPRKQLGDLAADPGEVLDEPLEVLDQPVLVGAERPGVKLVEIDRPLERSHERLRVLGEVGAAAHEVAQEEAGTSDIGLWVVRRLTHRAQPDRDVLECDRLERATPTELLVEHRERSLRRLASVGELVQEARAVEVLDARHPARVGVRAQVAPLLELGDRIGDRLLVGRAFLGQRFDQVLAAQVHDEPPLGGNEREHHLPVQRGVGRRQICERLEPLGVGLMSVCCECHRLAHGDSGSDGNVVDPSTILRVPSWAESAFRRVMSPEPTSIRIRTDELRTVREAKRDLGSLITELEAGEVEKLVLTRNRLRAVVVSIERWSESSALSPTAFRFRSRGSDLDMCPVGCCERAEIADA